MGNLNLRDILRETLENLKRPLVPWEETCFRPPEETAVLPLYRELRDQLKRLRLLSEEDPFANPILLLATRLARDLEQGNISYSTLEQLVQFVTVEGYVSRAERLHAYVGETDPLENLKRLEDLLEPENGLPFEEYARRLGQTVIGIVVTAHPTFALREDLLRGLSELASGRNVAGVPLSAEQVRELILQALYQEHLSDPEITLEKEHRLALEALGNLRRALARVYDLVFKIAAERYPEDWPRLRPRLITLASWVGYDLDGRRDIEWSQSFAFRLEERKIALSRYRESVQNLIDLCPIEEGTEALREILALLLKLLTEALKGTDEEIAAFQAVLRGDEESLETLRHIARKMYAGRAERLVHARPLLALIEEAINESLPYPALTRKLCLLRTEIENYGLGVSHIHVRLNAKQIHNAMRSLIGLETDPEDPSRKKSYLRAVNKLLEEVRPVTINFGSLIAERTTAKRLFMLVAQILKYVDAETPIRFLIAETESSFTGIAALYFAKLFGVEDRIDLSPLFETPRALSRGVRIIDEMLANSHFKEYVRRRGRLCVQTGFSDAGRHLGQTAAAFAIETFRRRLAKVLAKHDLKGLELIVFNTHGESLGRGAHPGSFRERLRYVMSPASRRELVNAGIKLKEEVSFQGGDGYVYFLNPNLSLSVVARLLEETFLPPEDQPDPFYREWDYVFEFFALIRQFNERIMADPDYAVLLQEYGRHFLYPTGSRAVKRQFEESRAPALSAAQIRAIPHNAILHQLGLLANTIGGVGAAIKRNPEQFGAMEESSERFRLLVSMARYAFSLSDFYAFSGYLEILDPNFWLKLAAKPPCPERAADLREVADYLEEVSKHVNLAKVGRTFNRDYLDLTEALTSRPSPGLLKAEERDALEILHAVRLALIYRIFTLAVQIPEFSPQRGTTREEIIERILHLDVEAAVATLKGIFPLLESLAETKDFGEEATYHTEHYLGYLREHREIFEPLSALYRLMKRISGGITHFIGSFG